METPSYRNYTVTNMFFILLLKILFFFTIVQDATSVTPTVFSTNPSFTVFPMLPNFATAINRLQTNDT